MRRENENDLDPLTGLAFSIQAAKGIYALLLGSGISRAAGIATGWEVTLDLIRRIAATEGEQPDPSTWYWNKFKREPGYSELLEKLAVRPSERTQPLTSYFEPDEADKEASRKIPTEAYRPLRGLLHAATFA